jgi:biopolymer transport protein ExbD
MKLKRRNKIQSEFNMSSMTDIIFLLLIFFIITSKFTPEPILKVLLPKGANKTVVKEVIKLSVDKNMAYAIDRKKVSFERLPDEMAEVLSKNPGATVSIYGDKSVEYDKVMELVFMVNVLGGKPVLALKPANAK